MRVIVTLVSALALVACSGDDGGVQPTHDTSSPATDVEPEGEDAEGDTLEDAADEPVEDAADEPVEDVPAPLEDATEPEESDSIGPDDTTTTEPDAPAPEPPSLCQILCESLFEDCQTYEPYGTDKTSCIAVCEDLQATSLDSLVALSCMSDSCDPVMCDPGDAPFPIPPACEEACALFEACDLMSVIQPNQPDNFELCLVGCASGHVVDPGLLPDVVDCVVEGLGEVCDPNILEACFPQGPGPGPGGEIPGCMDACSFAMEFKCPPWEDGPDAWQDAEACLADCQGYEDDASASGSTMYGCVVAASCDGLAHCTDPPAADDPGCKAACAKAFDTCPGFMPSLGFCEDYCTGQLMIFGHEVAEADAGTCIEGVSLSCDEDPFSALFACLLDLEDECNTICGSIDACSPDPDPAIFSGCFESCSAGFMNLFSPMGTGDLATCMEKAAGDCAASEACMVGPQPPPCYSLCTSGASCEPNQEMCMAVCDTKIADGALASVACEYADQCQTDGLCEGLVVDNAPAECVDACATIAGDTCSDYPGGCVAACQGLFTGSGSADPAMPYCIAPVLGSSCLIESAYWTCSQP
jgi:hypothetical protein